VVGDAHPAPLVEVFEPRRLRELDEPGDLLPREILGAPEHPRALVVDDEQGGEVHGVAAGDGAPHEVDHDVAAPRVRPIARVEGQLGQRVAVDAVRREGQRGLLGHAERRGRALALEGERSAVEAKAGTKSPRAALEEGGQQRKGREAVRDVAHRSPRR
jgi:hypothetical protein